MNVSTTAEEIHGYINRGWQITIELSRQGVEYCVTGPSASVYHPRVLSPGTGDDGFNHKPPHSQRKEANEAKTLLRLIQKAWEEQGQPI